MASAAARAQQEQALEKRPVFVEAGYSRAVLAGKWKLIVYGNEPATTFDYQPTPDAEGFDPLITDIRIRLGGSMPGTDEDGSPEFSIFYQVKVN